jgi:hypothetical protein
MGRVVLGRVVQEPISRPTICCTVQYTNMDDFDFGFGFNISTAADSANLLSATSSIGLL